MRNDKRWLVAAAGLGAVAMIAVPLWAAAANGKLMHMTMHMTMSIPGMPAMGPRTMEHDVCMPAGKFDPAAIQRATSRNKDLQCHVANLDWRGSDVSYDVTCSGKATIKIHTTAHIEGDNAFSGKSHAVIDAGQHAMTMDNDYTAKRIDSCNYTPPASS
jgi:hypothetical protein